MNDKPDTSARNGVNKATGGGPARQQDRRDRQAQSLRDNLKRRKRQARSRDDSRKPGAPSSSSPF